MKVSVPTWVRGFRWGPLLLALRLAGVSAAPAPATDVTERFYDHEVVQNVHLEIKLEDVDRMHRSLPQRIYVPGRFRWNDQGLTNVGVRFKGGSSSMPDSPFKRGYLIDFAEFQKGQRLLGLRQIALDNGIQFGSVFSERLITDVLRGVGVKASRCNYARLYLNGKFLGVYVNVERINKNFLQRHFGNDQGALFKVDESGPRAPAWNTSGTIPRCIAEASNWTAGRRPGLTRSCSNSSAPSMSPQLARRRCASDWTSSRS